MIRRKKRGGIKHQRDMMLSAGIALTRSGGIKQRRRACAYQRRAVLHARIISVSLDLISAKMARKRRISLYGGI